MFRRLFITMAVVICGLLIAASPIHAQEPLVTFYFVGQVVDVNDHANALGGSVSPDAIFSGSVSFDPTVEDTNPDNRLGFYRFVTPDEFSITLTIGTNQWTMSQTNQTHDASIGVVDADGTSGYFDDVYSIWVDSNQIEEPTGCSSPISLISIYLATQGQSDTAIVGDSLPIAPPELSNFQIKGISIGVRCDTSYEYQIFGTLTALYANPAQLLTEIADSVLEINLNAGIANSLDSKLDTALQALDDLNQNNDAAAIAALNAFINAVSAQSGNQIPTEDAEYLIALALAAIAALENP